MEVIDNEWGTKTVILSEGDSLDRVPKSHARMITKSVANVFKNVPLYFSTMASEASIASQSKWIQSLVASGTWTLKLHHGHDEKHYLAAFAWDTSEVHSTEFDVNPSKDAKSVKGCPSPVPAAFQYASMILWNGYYYPGTAFYPKRYSEMRNTYVEKGPVKSLKDAFMFGEWQTDSLVVTEKDQAGWHSNSMFIPLGTSTDALEWYFTTLLKNESPTGPDGG